MAYFKLNCVTFGLCCRCVTSVCVCVFSIQARIKTAKRRVVMASLYLGTGPLEQDLVGPRVCVCVCVKWEYMNLKALSGSQMA